MAQGDWTKQEARYVQELFLDCMRSLNPRRQRGKFAEASQVAIFLRTAEREAPDDPNAEKVPAPLIAVDITAQRADDLLRLNELAVLLGDDGLDEELISFLRQRAGENYIDDF